MLSKEANPNDWLEWFVGKESDAFPRPFRISDTERAATDGHLCAIDTDNLPGMELETHMQHKIVAKVGQLLIGDNRKSRSFDRNNLKEFFGECEHPCLDKCDVCNGRKERAHECNCEFCDVGTQKCGECDGKGVVDKLPATRPILIGNKAFDANKVAYCLEHMPEDEQLLEVVLLKKENWLVGLVGKNCRCIVVETTLEMTLDAKKGFTTDKSGLANLDLAAQQPSPATAEVAQVPQA